MNNLSFFFNDTATTEIYTLSLHDALPIFPRFLDAVDPGYLRDIARIALERRADILAGVPIRDPDGRYFNRDRKSTRLNSSHTVISYAVFCLKKKKAPRQRCIYRRASHPCR